MSPVSAVEPGRIRACDPRGMYDGAEGWVRGEAGWGVVKAEGTFPDGSALPR